MNLDPLQLFLQLGAIGAVLFVVWKIGAKLVDRQGETEKERTAAIAEGFRSITTSIQNHTATDVASHDRLSVSHGELAKAVTRLEGKIDAALDWQERTPVTPIERISRPPGTYGPRPGTKER